MAVRVDRFQPSKSQMDNVDLDGDHASGGRESPPMLRISHQPNKQQENSTTFGQLYTQQLATMVDIRWKCISFDLFYFNLVVTLVCVGMLSIILLKNEKPLLKGPKMQSTILIWIYDTFGGFSWCWLVQYINKLLQFWKYHEAMSSEVSGGFVAHSFPLFL